MENQLPDLEEAAPPGKKCDAENCGKDARYRCTGCSGASYCSKEHRMQDWDDHIPMCCPVRVETNEVLGRYMRATRTLPMGEVVFAEVPVMVGPKQDTTPVCLTCYRPVDGSYRCTKCNWPMCEADCQDDAEHQGECKVFAKHPEVASQITNFEKDCPVYECITPLRCLLLKEDNPVSWEAMSVMEDHKEARCTLDEWKVNKVNIVDFLRNKLGLPFEEEEIHKVIGILDVNCFEIRGDGFRIRGVYPRAAIMSHECVNNTHHIIESDQYRMVIRASISIPKGSLVTMQYTHTLNGTTPRRRQLQQGKYFLCSCRRCTDPTELGTHMSSLKCSKCGPGLVLPKDPLNDADDAEWNCDNCDFQLKNASVNKLLAVVENSIDVAGHDIFKLEETLRRYAPALHPNHWLLIGMKHSLSQLYGRAPGYILDDLPDVLLERKIDFCREVLGVADIIEPGLSRLRGVTMYEIHAPIFLLANRGFQYGELSQDEVRERLKEAQRFLKGAAEILSYEDPNTPEGQMAVAASGAMSQVQHCIDMVDEM